MPRDVTATVNGSTVIVKWQPPDVFDGYVDQYLVSWGTHEISAFRKTIKSSPFIHDFGSK